MGLHWNRPLHVLVALLVFINQIIFTSPGLSYAQSELQFERERATAVSSESYQAVIKEEMPADVPAQLLEILSQENPLSRVEDEPAEEETVKSDSLHGSPNPAAVVNRESFDYNRALLNQASEEGLPMAFIVDDLDAEKLKSLVNNEKSEILILAFRAEDKVKYLLYTSGNQDDVRVNPLVQDLIESLQSSGGVLVAHSHLDPSSQGPSSFDQDHANKVEAVLTAEGGYLYGPGIAVTERLDYDTLMGWFQTIQKPMNGGAVVDEIHKLLAEVDAQRVLLKENPELVFEILRSFRESDLTTDARISLPSTFISPTVIAADTASKVAADPGYFDNFDVSVLSTARLRISYSDLDTAGEWAGVTLDNSDGALMDFSALSELTFKLSSSEETSDVRVEIVQSGTGMRDVFNITGLGILEKSYQLDLTQLSFDSSTIESINFIRDSEMTPNGRGYFEVVLPSQSGYGINPSLADSAKAEGDITLLPLGATQGALADTAGGAVSELSEQSATGATIAYSGLDALDGVAGVTWEYSAAGKDFSKRKVIVLALEGTAAGARLEVEDALGRKAFINLSGISNDHFQYYSIDLNDPAIAAQLVDLSKITRVSVVTSQTLAGNASGSLTVKLAQMTAETPLTGTTTFVTQLETGKFDIKVYSIDPTRTDLHGKILKHTLQQNKGASTYEITTLEVLSDGTDTGRWLSLHQQKQLAVDTFEIKTYAIVGDEPGEQLKGGLQTWFIQERQGADSFEITEIHSDEDLQQIREQKPLSATKLEIWTYAADFTDAEIRLAAGSTLTSSVTSSDKVTARLNYAGLDLGDPEIYAGAAWVYASSTWPAGVNYSDMTLHFSLKGTAAKAWLIIEDVTGQITRIPFQGISDADYTDYSVSMNDPTLTSAIDITKIRQIRFQVDGPDAGNAAGTLDIQLKELPYSNFDGIKGALQSHVIQEDLGGDTTRITTFDGLTTDEVISVVEQTELAVDVVEVKTYQASIVPAVVFEFQDFEGAFPPAEYTTSEDAPWIRNTTQFHDGAASASSGVVGDSGRSVFTLTYDAPEDGVLSFFWKVSSEANFDYFYFCVDQEICSRETSTASISGEEDWDDYAANLTAGSHALTWVYEKDGSINAGSDIGWLDEVKFATRQTLNAVLESRVIQESLGEGRSRITTFKVEEGISTEEVTSIVEQTQLSAASIDIQTYLVELDGSVGTLQSHVIQQDLGDGTFRITTFDGVTTDDVISIVEQKELPAGTVDIKTYQVNLDDSKGDLQSHVVQKDLGNGVLQITTYRVLDGASTDEVVSIVVQTQLSADTVDLNIYQNVVEVGVNQDFEGAFPPEGYTTSGEAAWIQDTTTFYEGVAAASSGDIDDAGRSILQSTYNAPAAGTLSFFWKVSSETLYDYLYFCVDQESCTAETSLAAIEGARDWAAFSTSLSAGPHVLTWIYEKDLTLSEGSDRGWIDGVQFTVAPALNLVLQNHVIQENLAGSYRITSYAVEEGVSTDEIVSTENQTEPVVAAFDTVTYQAVSAPAVIQEAQEILSREPFKIVTQTGAVNAENPGERFDPDDGSSLSPDSSDPELPTEFPQDTDNFLGRDVANGGGGSAGSSSTSSSDYRGSQSRGLSPSSSGVPNYAADGGTLSFSGSGKKGGSSVSPVISKTFSFKMFDADDEMAAEIGSVGNPIADSLLYFPLTPLEKMAFENEPSKLFQALQYFQYKPSEELELPKVVDQKENQKQKAEKVNALKSLFERVFQKKRLESRQVYKARVAQKTKLLNIR